MSRLVGTHTGWEGEVVVTDKKVVADGVVELRLARAEGGVLPAWEPGAHIDVIVPDGPTRQYSLCSDPDDLTTWRIGVLRERDAGASAYIHDRLEIGSVVAVRGPRNHFPLVPAERYVFIAGGIGITPLIPMVEKVDRAGLDWTLHYGGRRRSSMAFLCELVDKYGDRVVVTPEDRAGLLDLDAILGTPEPDTSVYCCGPEPLLVAVERRCAPWPPDALHLERFSPIPVDPDAPDNPVDVELALSNQTLHVPAGVSILDVVEKAGVSVLSSCREGTCGTCETVVLEGTPDHRDSLLTEAEQEEGSIMMICVSRARSSRLVLEL
jgi:ferredoxin-NADP reductase